MHYLKNCFTLLLILFLVVSVSPESSAAISTASPSTKTELTTKKPSNKWFKRFKEGSPKNKKLRKIFLTLGLIPLTIVTIGTLVTLITGSQISGYIFLAIAMMIAIVLGITWLILAIINHKKSSNSQDT